MTLSIACINRSTAGVVVILAAIALTPREVWAQEAEPALLLLDRTAIAADQSPTVFTEGDVNTSIAAVGLRESLPYFASHVGDSALLPGGQVGNEGWFGMASTPISWATAESLSDGAANFVGAGPGLGSPDAQGDASSLLTSVHDVTALGAEGLAALVGRQVCGVVYEHELQVDAETQTADLSGANLGLVAFTVLGVAGQNGELLPDVEVEILDANQVCHGPVALMTSAP